MEQSIFIDSALTQYIVIPVLICLCRICDVTMGTMRIITASKGMKALTTIFAFFENELKKVLEIIKKFNPNAFYTIEDIKSVSALLFPVAQKTKKRFLRPFKFFPKRQSI